MSKGRGGSTRMRQDEMNRVHNWTAFIPCDTGNPNKPKKGRRHHASRKKK